MPPAADYSENRPSKQLCTISMTATHITQDHTEHRTSIHCISLVEICSLDIPNELSIVGGTYHHAGNAPSSQFPTTRKPKRTMVPPPSYHMTNMPPRRRSPDGSGMLKKRVPTILDDVALPSMRRAKEEKHDATTGTCTSCRTGPSLADDEDRVKISKNTVVRYQPEPLTKEELDFFLSLDFEADGADDNDNSMAAASTCAPFPIDAVLVGQGNCSANGLQDSTSTLQSNISSLSTVTASTCGYCPNQSFSTLQTSTSSDSTFRDEMTNQVHGQEVKLISTMKRSAESREAVQRLVRSFHPAPMQNATFDVDASPTHYNRGASHPPECSVNKIETKRKYEAMSSTEKEAGLKEVRTHFASDFIV